jgi:hypothetical protein
VCAQQGRGLPVGKALRASGPGDCGYSNFVGGCASISSDMTLTAC